MISAPSQHPLCSPFPARPVSAPNSLPEPSPAGLRNESCTDPLEQPFFGSIFAKGQAGDATVPMQWAPPAGLVLAVLFIFVLDLPTVAVIITLLGIWLTTAMSSQCVGQSGINPMEVFGIFVMAIAKLDKCQCNKLASIATTATHKAIRPVHSTADGDTIYLMASGEPEVGVDAPGALATECIGCAINRDILNTEPPYGLKAAKPFP